jgi:hypothetical protein
VDGVERGEVVDHQVQVQLLQHLVVRPRRRGQALDVLARQLWGAFWVEQFEPVPTGLVILSGRWRLAARSVDEAEQ